MKTNIVYSFERLIVWQKSCDFAAKIYELTKSFPKEEKFGLQSQLRRAAVSISSNLAEGTSRNSRKDQARFTEIAYGSLLEVISQLQISKKIGVIDEQQLLQLKLDGSEIGKMLSNLRKSQLSRLS